MKALLILPLPALLLLGSCNVAYRSSVIHTPLFSEKKEVSVTAASNNVQAAYAVSDHVGFMANGFYEQSIVSDDETGNGGKGYLVELGAGYFTGLANPNIIVETYAGMGMGHLYLNNNYEDPLDNVQKRTFDADGFKFFVQPAIGYRLPYFEVSVAARYSNINYTNVRTSNWPDDELRKSKLDNLGSTTYHFAEPAFTIRGGIRNIKLQLQYLYCIKLNSEALNFGDDLLSIGIFVKLPAGKNP